MRFLFNYPFNLQQILQQHCNLFECRDQLIRLRLRSDIICSSDCVALEHNKDSKIFYAFVRKCSIIPTFLLPATFPKYYIHLYAGAKPTLYFFRNYSSSDNNRHHNNSTSFRVILHEWLNASRKHAENRTRFHISVFSQRHIMRVQFNNLANEKEHSGSDTNGGKNILIAMQKWRWIIIRRDVYLCML